MPFALDPSFIHRSFPFAEQFVFDVFPHSSECTFKLAAYLYVIPFGLQTPARKYCVV